jgi:SAM-dependent methyltransferase
VVHREVFALAHRERPVMSAVTTIDYASSELDAMARARNYYRWILSAWRPHLGRVVVEFGAGIGTFSARLLEEPRVDRLFLVEPAPALHGRLATRFRDIDRVRVIPGILHDAADALTSVEVDSIVSVNVLEHIHDDVGTLRAAHDILRPGGRLFIFVPAFQFLYGSLDRAFGHVRRYTKRSLVALLESQGYEIVASRYMNLLGTVSWLMAGRVLRRHTLAPEAVALADRTLIPLSAGLERWFRPPFGQNVMVIARKPGV